MFASHFSAHNIPFGIASSEGHPSRSAATRLEDTVIYLDELAKHDLLYVLPKEALDAFSQVRGFFFPDFFHEINFWGTPNL